MSFVTKSYDNIDDAVNDMEQENNEMEKRHSKRNQKLINSLNTPPKPHLQVKSTTDKSYYSIPQCPLCKNIDIRFQEKFDLSSLVIYVPYCGSGYDICCIPCSTKDNLSIFHFYNGQDMWWNPKPEDNNLHLSKDDLERIQTELK